jgi:hypothetical protein
MEYRVCFYRIGVMESVQLKAESRIQAMYAAIRVAMAHGSYQSRKHAARCIIACFEFIEPRPAHLSYSLNPNYVPGSKEVYS